MPKAFFRILDFCENIFASLAKILLLFMTVIIILNVVSRNLFNISLMWATEISEYILLYVTFLGTALVLKHDGHVQVDIIDRFINKKTIFVLNILINVIGLIVSAILFWYGLKVTLDALQSNLRSLTIMKVPLGYVYMVIPAGSLLLMLEFTRKLFYIGKKKENVML